MTSPQLPRPFGSEALAMKDFDAVVEDLAVPHRSRAALRRLIEAGPRSRAAVRRGVSHPDPAVRSACCEILDKSWDPDAYDDLAALLNDDDPTVRWRAAHTLTCERCKRRNTWVYRARSHEAGEN